MYCQNKARQNHIIIINILIFINPTGNTCPVIGICISLMPKQDLSVQLLHYISFLIGT